MGVRTYEKDNQNVTKPPFDSGSFPPLEIRTLHSLFQVCSANQEKNVAVHYSSQDVLIDLNLTVDSLRDRKANA